MFIQPFWGDYVQHSHSAHFDAQFGCGCFDQPGRAAGQHEMRARFRLRVNPGMKMQKVGVDRWGHSAGIGIDAHLAIMSGAPDRHATPRND